MRNPIIVKVVLTKHTEKTTTTEEGTMRETVVSTTEATAEGEATIETTTGKTATIETTAEEDKTTEVAVEEETMIEVAVGEDAITEVVAEEETSIEATVEEETTTTEEGAFLEKDPTTGEHSDLNRRTPPTEMEDLGNAMDAECTDTTLLTATSGGI